MEHKINIDLFKDFTGTDGAEITGNGIYYTVVRTDLSDKVEVFDMKQGLLYKVEGTFIQVAIRLALGQLELDPAKAEQRSMDPIDGDPRGFISLENGELVDCESKEFFQEILAFCFPR